MAKIKNIQVNDDVYELPQKISDLENDLPLATTENDGLMSKEDKGKLDDTWSITIASYDNNDIYQNAIAELYLLPNYTNDNLFIKVYEHCFYFRQVVKNTSSYEWNGYYQIINTTQNNKVYEITSAPQNGANTGDVIGYVVFKDIDSIATLSDTSIGVKVNSNYVINLKNSPIIANSILVVDKIADSAVKANNIADRNITTDKLANGAVTFQKIADENIYSDLPISSIAYEDTIKDIWFDKNYLENIININVRCYEYDIIIRAFSVTEPYGTGAWTCRKNIATLKDGQLFEITITQTNNANISVGTLVGYIIFQNVGKFRSFTSTFGNEYINIPFATSSLNIYHTPIYLALNSSNNENNAVEIPDLYLPSDLYCTKGDVYKLFYRNIVKAHNPYAYNIQVISSVGKAYPRYYSLDANTIGDYPITINITDNNGGILKTATTTLHILNTTTAPSAKKNILTIGASATATGYIASELNRRLTSTDGDGTTQNPKGLGLANISFVGRKVGTIKPIKQEATGGWSWAEYSTKGRSAIRLNVSNVSQLYIGDTYTQGSLVLQITEINVTNGAGNIRCTYEGSGTLTTSGTLTKKQGNGDATITYSSYTNETYNPFWNNDKFDFANYANLYCDGAIDILIAHCGMNDISAYTPQTIDNLFKLYIKPFIRAYHEDFSNGKFILSTLPLPSVNGGMGANYGASATWNYYTIALRLWAFAEKCHELAKESEFANYVVVADDLVEFDAENSYPTTQTPLNNRVATTETLGTNGVHPIMEGSYQISDTIYHSFSRLNL